MSKPLFHESDKVDKYCYHCGENVPASLTLSIEIEGKQRAMCCRGCLAVAQCILGSGLNDYYRFRSDNPATPDSRDEDYSLYDNPGVLADFSHALDDSGTRQESRLSVAGLHCAACAWLIENRLQRLPGIESVSVHLQNALVTIRWRRDEIKMSEIMIAIHQLGYQALPYSPANRDQHLQEELDGLLRRLGLAGIGMMQVGMVAIGLYAGDFQGMDDTTRNLLRYFSLAVATPVLLYSAQPFFRGAWRSLKAGQPGMDVPVSLALVAAFTASVLATLQQQEHVYFDTVSMFTFFLLLSRYLQAKVRQTQTSNTVLLPLAARKITQAGDNSYQWLPLKDLQRGDIISVVPGETIPIDGRVLRGQSSVETSAFNGEFLPVQVAIGSTVLAGSGNIDGSLDIEVTATASQSSIVQMEALLEQAHAAKPKFAQLADRLASHFVSAVILLALASYLYWLQHSPEQAFIIALSVLVVSCPCALSLATPTTFTAAVSSLRRDGIVLRSTQTLEALHKVDRVIFDKTGTLTLGKPHIQSSHYYQDNHEQIMRIAAALEQHSNHPVAEAFRRPSNIDLPEVHKLSIYAGEGIAANIDGESYRIGQGGFCIPLADLPSLEQEANNTEVYLVSSKGPLARFILEDSLRPEAAALVSEIRDQGIAITILSGDKNQAVAKIANTLNIPDYHGEFSAAAKLEAIHRYQAAGERVLMVGDGINDAPILSAADMSIAMSSASALTRNQADVSLLDNSLSAVSTLFATAKRSRRLLKENIGWALLYNLTSLPLAAVGLVPPWLAAIGMSTSSLVVVLNALRIKGKANLSDSKKLPIQAPVKTSVENAHG
ncbi:heavy metal translocating P-type ATPase [Zhongshania arctica]|uniref:Heavy metal translocating P-type ATPase n=1 Tax=Zhongshania arctica TaxID=3238302 RepID=A0ABV3TV69_9GAMM